MQAAKTGALLHTSAIHPPCLCKLVQQVTQFFQIPLSYLHAPVTHAVDKLLRNSVGTHPRVGF